MGDSVSYLDNLLVVYFSGEIKLESRPDFSPLELNLNCLQSILGPTISDKSPPPGNDQAR